MSLLFALLLVNAVLHVVVVARYGIGNHHQPFFAAIPFYLGLAAAVHFSWPHALWAVLLLSSFGLFGLTVSFNKPVRDKTLDKVIWVLDATAILWAGWLIFLA